MSLGTDKKPNLFLYRKRSDGWRLLFETYHAGAIMLPYPGAPGAYTLNVSKSDPIDSRNPTIITYTFAKGRLRATSAPHPADTDP